MISFKTVNFSYHGSGHEVYRDFNLELKPNRIYGLLGKNATGKSTLLYLISGLLRPSAGTVTIDGEETQAMSRKMLSSLFLVPEDFDLPEVTLKEYVEMYRPFYPSYSPEVMESCLREFELPGDMRLKELSMGTKKKVLMSFALAVNTPILLMDEPTNGLDIPSKRQFRKVVASHAGNNRLILISTHQVHDVETLLDHILILGHDGLLCNQSTEAITSRYSFGSHPAGETLYREQGLDGERTVALRSEDDEETPLDLELFFQFINAKKH